MNSKLYIQTRTDLELALEQGVSVYCDNLDFNDFYIEQCPQIEPTEVICFVSTVSKQHALENKDIKIIPEYFKELNYYKDNKGKNWKYVVPVTSEFICPRIITT